ncbi:hypothetical protein SAMN05421505_10246 [Sinosporangium album]|uniref:Uncharacterized protein n=1 Tax=Sinosporangium album TaxID=504805 RepID=A0A1G7RWY7_9ACTN|nr:hypothetical protein [Sinosporangium album]SDG14320.1 hypothetical protein SAMN05421505_10246 [Sinosporangium album]
MIKKLCVTGAVLAAATGAALVSTPAHADSWGNWTRNSGSSQSGNQFGNVSAANVGAGKGTQVNNINGVTGVANNGAVTVIYRWS